MSTEITALPTPPSRQDPDSFAARGDAFLSALPNFVTEANSLAAEIEERSNEIFAELETDAIALAVEQSGLARDQAIAAANATGDVLIFDTKSEALAALGGLSEDDIVEVLVDESRNDRRVRYRVELSALVFKLYMDVQYFASSIIALQGVDTSEFVGGEVRHLIERTSGVMIDRDAVFYDLNKESEVVQDVMSGIWIAPSGQDGSLGAWKIQWGESIPLSAFGFVDGTVSDASDYSEEATASLQAVADAGIPELRWDVDLTARLVRHPDMLHIRRVGDKKLIMPNGFDSREDCGLKPVSGMTFGMLTGFSVDGNANRAAQYDATNAWADGFDPGFDGDPKNFVKGRFHASGVFCSAGKESSWVSPDVYVVNGLCEVNNTVRNNFIFQMNYNRGVNPPGLLLVNGTLKGKNSRLDHIVYADQAARGYINRIEAEGYSFGAHVAESGIRINSLNINISEANPDSNADNSFSFESFRCVDNRDDTHGSNIGAMTVEGDLSLLDGAGDFNNRMLFEFRGEAPRVDSIRVEHDGGDTEFALFKTRQTSGISIGTLTGLNMPDSAQWLVHDYKEEGENLNGFHMNVERWTWREGAAAVSQALVHLGDTDTAQVRDVIIEGGDVRAQGTTEAGATHLVSGTFTDGVIERIGIRGTNFRSTDNGVDPIALPPVSSDLSFSGCYLDGIKTRNSRPSGRTLSQFDLRNNPVFKDDQEYLVAGKEVGVATTDATPEVFYTTPVVTNNTVMLIKVRGAVVNSGGSRRDFYERVFQIYRTGGTAPQNAGTVDLLSTPTYTDITVAANGNAMEVSFTGETSQNYTGGFTVEISIGGVV